MNYSMIRYILACVLSFEGIFLTLPAIVSGIYGEKQGIVFLAVAVGCLVVGTLGRIKKPKSKNFFSREGFVTVSLSWILLSLIGALPFTLTGEIPFYIDALFETTSGFTTTGSSILSDVEALSRGTLFWRSFTHWVGGMGVLVFIMAVLPLSGSSNMHLMRAESPGPSVGKLVPKVKRTAMILYGIYIGITITEIIALIITGMTPYEAMTLSFGTVGTGGFGLLNSSIASYSIASQIVIIIFMLVCSINFNVYYLLLIRKTKEAFLNEEMRYFLIIVFSSVILITINIKDTFTNLFEAFHTSMFQVAAIISTTGYSTADFDKWPEFSKTILVLLMVIGACAGSTGGGFKVSRLVIILKSVKSEIMSIIHPRSVQKVHFNGRQVPNDLVKKIMCYLGAYALITLVSILVVSLDGKDMTTNITSVVATFNNIGPGLNAVGPTSNFGSFGVLSKIVFILDMLIGRLEIFPLLVLLVPGIWKLPIRKNEKRKVSAENE